MIPTVEQIATWRPDLMTLRIGPDVWLALSDLRDQFEAAGNLYRDLTAEYASLRDRLDAARRLNEQLQEAHADELERADTAQTRVSELEADVTSRDLEFITERLSWVEQLADANAATAQWRLQARVTELRHSWPYQTPSGHVYHHPTTLEEIQRMLGTVTQGDIESWADDEMPPDPSWAVVDTVLRELDKANRVLAKTRRGPKPKKLAAMLKDAFENTHRTEHAVFEDGVGELNGVFDMETIARHVLSLLGAPDA